MDGFLIAISIFVLQRVVCLCLGNLRPLARLRSGPPSAFAARGSRSPPAGPFLLMAGQTLARTAAVSASSYGKNSILHTHTHVSQRCLTTAVTIEFALLPFAALGFYIDFGQVGCAVVGETSTELTAALSYRANWRFMPMRVSL